MTVSAGVKAAAARAAGVVRSRGLAKGVYFNDDGEVCALGAARIAVFGKTSPWSDLCGDPSYSVYRQFVAELERRVGAVTHWSDWPDRSAEEVARMFEAIANS